MQEKILRCVFVVWGLLLLSGGTLYASEPCAPFREEIPDRPFLSEGSVPFPAPRVFDQKPAEKIRAKFGVEKVVFVERATFQSSHYYTDYIDGSRFFGTDICILDLKTGEVTKLLPDSMKSGIINRFDISFDAKKIVFDWKKDNKSGFHIWEIGVDGTNLRQLTFPQDDDAKMVEKYAIYRSQPRHWVRKPECYPVNFGVYQRWTDDMHPCYLSDGGIAFVSTRCRHGILCDGDDVLTTTVLYRMDAEGKKIEKLTNSAVSEATPVLLDDGRILYTRWEYVDKGGSCVKCLWSMKQDGSGSAEVFGGTHAMPPSILHGRRIPGQKSLYTATAAPHCPQTGVGTIVRIDTSRDIRSADAMEHMTPETKCRGEGNYIHTNPPQVSHVEMRGPCFADAWPLDKETLLMSAMLDDKAFWYRPDGYGIYLYNGPSDYELLYRSAGTSCWAPTPLLPRAVPPLNVSPLDEALADGASREGKFHGRKAAVCLVADVYVGMEGIQRGEAKYLRINEQLPRPWSARRMWGNDYQNNPGVDVYDQQHSPAGATHLGVRVQWGVVPIEEDGSAHFYVPADGNVFFQVLDENFQEIQRERTYVNYRPGETRACIGCHEAQQTTPSEVLRQMPRAFEREPSWPAGQPGEKEGARCISFVADVQPILDAKCVVCHNGEFEKDGVVVQPDLRGTLTPFFNVAYENLLGFRCSRDHSYSVSERPAHRSLVGRVVREIHPKVGNAEYFPPKTLGSTTAPLVRMLRDGHYDVQLTQEEMIRITTWIDSNCQYYGTYWGAKHVQFRDLPHFRMEATFDEAIGREPPQRSSEEGT
ncbi:MAG: hypothetical protein Q4D38_05610 [Planctomycetia bacterium]|nr:hypothetical protein [Planctomycetia bacterium]